MFKYTCTFEQHANLESWTMVARLGVFEFVTIYCARKRVWYNRLILRDASKQSREKAPNAGQTRLKLPCFDPN